MADILKMVSSDGPRFGLIEQEQLAAQVVAVLDAHFKRPTVEEKQAILKTACLQVEAMRLL